MRSANIPNRNANGMPMNCVTSSAPIIALSSSADLGAVDRRHPDDRLDAVVVDQEREQQHERLPVARAARGTSRAAACRPPSSALPDGRSRDSIRRGGSGTWRNSGIENTTHQTATLARLARTAISRLGRPNHRRSAHHQDVDREQHAAADVADRVAGRRHAIELVLAARGAAAATRRTRCCRRRRRCR